MGSLRVPEMRRQPGLVDLPPLELGGSLSWLSQLVLLDSRDSSDGNMFRWIWFCRVQLGLPLLLSNTLPVRIQLLQSLRSLVA